MVQLKTLSEQEENALVVPRCDYDGGKVQQVAEEDTENAEGRVVADAGQGKQEVAEVFEAANTWCKTRSKETRISNIRKLMFEFHICCMFIGISVAMSIWK